jgi:hypothetical protein
MDAYMPVALALPPPDPGFEILLSTRGVSQGLVQTDGQQLVPRLFVRIGEAQIGAQWKNIDAPSAKGVAAFFVKLNHKTGKGQIDAGVAYRVRTGLKAPADGEAWEFMAGARRDFGPLALRASVEYSPEEFGSGKSLYVELGPALQLDAATRLSAAAGRRERERAPDYSTFNFGVSRIFRQKLTIDARYYDTNRGELGRPYRARVIFSARLAL